MQFVAFSDSIGSDSVFPTSSAVKKKPTVANKSWRKLIYHEWDLISNHRLGLTFMSKLKKDSYPGFYDAVKEVLDLKGIKSRVRDGVCYFLLGFAQLFYDQSSPYHPFDLCCRYRP